MNSDFVRHFGFYERPDATTNEESDPETDQAQNDPRYRHDRGDEHESEQGFADCVLGNRSRHQLTDDQRPIDKRRRKHPRGYRPDQPSSWNASRDQGGHKDRNNQLKPNEHWFACQIRASGNWKFTQTLRHLGERFNQTASTTAANANQRVTRTSREGDPLKCPVG